MAPSKCTICGKDTTARCGRCKAATYCSAECQMKDRSLHKILRNKYTAFLETRPIPTDNDKEYGDTLPVTYKLAILFPATAKTPKLIWLKVHTRSEFDSLSETEEDPAYHFYQTSYYDLKDHMESPRAMPHSRNDQDLNIYMGDHCLGEDPTTQSLLTLNAGYGLSEYGSIAVAPWAGNLVVVNMMTERRTHPEFGAYRKEPNPYFIRKDGRWFKAVKICCSGDMRFEGKRRYTEVAISRYHPLFSSNDGTSGISDFLGFPLLVKRLQNPRLVERMRNRPYYMKLGLYENLEACFLMIDHDAKSTGMDPWDKGICPTVLVARQDMKDLTVHQVEVLVGFCETLLKKWMNDQDALLSSNFAEFFEEFKQKKLAEGDATWADVTVPPKGSVADKEIYATREEEFESLMRSMVML